MKNFHFSLKAVQHYYNQEKKEAERSLQLILRQREQSEKILKNQSQDIERILKEGDPVWLWARELSLEAQRYRVEKAQSVLKKTEDDFQSRRQELLAHSRFVKSLELLGARQKKVFERALLLREERDFEDLLRGTQKGERRGR